MSAPWAMLSSPIFGTWIASDPPTANVVLVKVRGAMSWSSEPASDRVRV
jgi:hypothetical protein